MTLVPCRQPRGNQVVLEQKDMDCIKQVGCVMACECSSWISASRSRRAWSLICRVIVIWSWQLRSFLRINELFVLFEQINSFMKLDVAKRC